MIEWFNMRSGGAISGKWRILDGNVESGMDRKFEALQGGSPCLC
jgi:hypothetical protein